LRPEERDPKVTTSYGVGVLIAAAVEAGARSVVIGLGGSATNDGGAGMLTALGMVPRDANGGPLPYGGAALAAVASVEGTAQLRGAALVAATDVDSPLLGLRGASAIFGPQKGATDNDVQLLDAALGRWADVLQRDVATAPPGLADQPGAGAAGGIGAALFALGGSRASGIDLVREAVGLDAELAGCDLAVTGEGRFDWQSLQGKVAVGVAAGAAEHGVPCIVLAGQVAAGQREIAAAGIERAYSVAERAGSVEAALAEPARRLEELAEHVAGQWRT
ncbi:MAG TPA: glycerate kinase, partial [Mycobacteriales bacterium]|nr:glycerate kinase [Mycobacteriales bacterium]